MILLISHFGSNKGTTDYYEQYLMSEGIQYYYLRHPFQQVDSNFSELFFFDGKKKICISTYKKSANVMLDLVRNIVVSVFVTLKLKHRVNLVIGFGSFNVISGLLMKILFGKKVFFWGVDYSRNRFSNDLMNRIYLGLETMACKLSDLVIQPTKRQESAREKFHCLKKQRSLVLPNGINAISNRLIPSPGASKSFVYFGSITEQHGIVEFIERYYLGESVKNVIPTYIFGGGESAAKLKGVIGKIQKTELVQYYGPTEYTEMIAILKKHNHEYIGLAPYSTMSMTDHAYFGDSLKIKEYLALGIVYITSSVVEIPEDLRPFGFVYENEEGLDRYLKEIASFPSLDTGKMRPVLERYLWNSLCKRVPINNSEL